MFFFGRENPFTGCNYNGCYIFNIFQVQNGMLVLINLLRQSFSIGNNPCNWALEIQIPTCSSHIFLYFFQCLFKSWNNKNQIPYEIIGCTFLYFLKNYKTNFCNYLVIGANVGSSRLDRYYFLLLWSFVSTQLFSCVVFFFIYFFNYNFFFKFTKIRHLHY